MCETYVGLLLDALKKDDVCLVTTLLSTNPVLFELAARTWKENPLLVAFNHGSSRVLEQIALQNPQFAKEKDREGYTVLHLASAKGDVQVVRCLAGLYPKLCLVKDKFSKIPLQTAIANGYGEVIRVLVAASPESIRRVTSARETVFHLAVKNFQCGAFEVLLEEARKLSAEHLLLRKDLHGSNVLHLATSNQLIKILKLLFPQNTKINGVLVRVNSLDKSGRTALDIFCANSHDISTREIGNILRNAGGFAAESLPLRARLRWTLETKNVILVVLGIVTGASFTTVCNLPSSFLQSARSVAGGAVMFNAGDVVSCKLPTLFYLMVFNTAILVVCMVAIPFLMWSLPFRPVVLFVTVTLGIVYGLLVNNVLPKSWVRFGTHDILSSVLVWLLALAFIGSAAALYYMIRYAFAFTKALIEKIRIVNALWEFGRSSIN